MMFRFPSVICTRCTGFFCLAIIKGPPNDIYCTIEEPSKHYFTEKVSYSLQEFRFELSQGIRSQIFFATFVKNIETHIKSNAMTKALKQLIHQQVYHL